MAHCIFLHEQILKNYRLADGLCKKNNVQLNVVTKFCLSAPDIVSALYNCEDAPCAAISDSNMENFLQLPLDVGARLTKCCIKMRLSDIQRFLEYPSYARPNRIFVSDERLLEAVSQLPASVRPDIVLIAETGDLKDGIPCDDIPRLAERWASLPIMGVSANFACLSGILPDSVLVKRLALCAEEVQRVRGLDKPFLSLGGTVVHGLLEKTELLNLATEVRMGEGIFFGYDSSGGMALSGFERQTILLCGEVLEIREKDTALQAGRTAGHSATGGEAVFMPGKRKRAVLDFGILAACADTIVPLDAEICVCGQTFDFTVIDITNSKKTYQVGDSIPFVTNYASASFAMMNRYIPRRLGKGV